MDIEIECRICGDPATLLRLLCPICSKTLGSGALGGGGLVALVLWLVSWWRG